MSPDGSSCALNARILADALRRRRHEPGPLLRRFGIGPHVLTSDDCVDLDVMRELWEAGARLAGDPFLGLHVAEELEPGGYELVDYLLATSATLGDAFERVLGVARSLNGTVPLHAHVEGRTYRVVRRTTRPRSQFEEYGAALMVVRTRQATGVHWTPRYIRFQHERPGPADELERFFGCPVTFGAREFEAALPREALALPNQRADSKLLALLTRYAELLVAGMPRDDDIVTRAAGVVARRFAQGIPDLEETASLLGMSARTLQRRLAARRTSLSSIVDGVRRSLSLTYLADERLSIAEVGYLLHYSEPAAFHHAFRRWHGEAPARFRRRILDSQAG